MIKLLTKLSGILWDLFGIFGGNWGIDLVIETVSGTPIRQRLPPAQLLSPALLVHQEARLQGLRHRRQSGRLHRVCLITATQTYFPCHFTLLCALKQQGRIAWLNLLNDRFRKITLGILLWFSFIGVPQLNCYCSCALTKQGKPYKMCFRV